MRFATPFGAYEIDSFQSQPQVAHCHGFFVHQETRGEGLAHLLKKHQMANIVQLGYDFATCTVCASNAAQKKVLTRAGWRRLASFVSSKTGEQVELWGVVMLDPRNKCVDQDADTIEHHPDAEAGLDAKQARPLADWNEDVGVTLWWRFPVEEPPYCGSPTYDDWPGYHTHWTPILVPHEPSVDVVDDAT